MNPFANFESNDNEGVWAMPDSVPVSDTLKSSKLEAAAESGDFFDFSAPSSKERPVSEKRLRRKNEWSYFGIGSVPAGHEAAVQDQGEKGYRITAKGTVPTYGDPGLPPHAPSIVETDTNAKNKAA